MRAITYGLVLCCVLATAGCASFGTSADKTAMKLRTASELFNKKEEPIEAEELIREAIEAYKKDNNQLGLAEAYRQYGFFFRSNAVNKREKYYKEKGFEDNKAKFAQRYEKAVEYFTKSKDLYADYGHIDILSNLYISLAKTYDLMKRQAAACEAFDKGLENYSAYKKLNPEAVEFRSEEMQNYVEYIDTMKKQVGCPESALTATSGGEPTDNKQTADAAGRRTAQ